MWLLGFELQTFGRAVGCSYPLSHLTSPQMMTFDSEIVLMKVARAHPKSKLVLWIATDDSKAVCRLSVKFGVTLKTSRLLLERSKELNIDVIGVSFHVGSGCTDL
jgi:ornithine decarboxylase